MEQTETQERFEEKLKECWLKIDNSTFTHGDGIEVYALAENLLLRYEQIRKSRDNWRKKYEELKND